MKNIHADVAQFGRASRCQRECHEFNPRHLLQLIKQGDKMATTVSELNIKSPFRKLKERFRKIKIIAKYKMSRKIKQALKRMHEADPHLKNDVIFAIILLSCLGAMFIMAAVLSVYFA